MTEPTHSRVLVVDDDKAVRRVIESHLKNKEMQVTTASSYDDALACMEKEPFELLLTDHMMPGRPGLDLIMETEKRYPACIKVLLTGVGDRELYREAINMGAVFSVIEKPFQATELFDTVDRALEFQQQRQHDREELQQLRKQYSLLFDHTTDCIQCTDPSGRLIYANPSWYATLGYTREDSDGHTIYDFLPEGEKGHFTEIREALGEKKQFRLFETEMLAKSGERVFLEGSATGQFQDDRLNTITYIFRDVTHRKKYARERENLLRQETMVARIAEQLATAGEPFTVFSDVLKVIVETLAVDGGYLYAAGDRDGETLFRALAVWNRGIPRIDDERVRYLYSRDIPQLCTKLTAAQPLVIESCSSLPEPDRGFLHSLGISSALMLPVIIGGEMVGVLGIHTAGNERAWPENEIKMLKAAADIIANAWTRQNEIEMRREKEREAEQSRLLVIRADRLAALGTMAAGIIHEITQPLNVINVSSQTLLYGMSKGWDFGSEQVNNSLTLIVDQVKRMDTIIKNIRTFTRDSQSMKKEKDNINRQVELVFSMLGEQIRSHDITIDLSLSDVPDTIMNAHQVFQVILNLVTNARQALDDMEGDDKRIRVTTHAGDGGCVLTIADNGPGVPESIREKIFDPFFTTKEVGKGTGLGLSISLGIIDDHGGSLDIRSNDMGGAAFVLTLPVRSEASEETHEYTADR